MKHRTQWRRLAARVMQLTAVFALVIPVSSAIAQQVAPQADEQAGQPPTLQPAEVGTGDVPGRVARLNYFDGSVTFEPAGGNEWAYAELNRPMTTGDQVWVDNGGRSELHIGSTALRLGQQTALSIVNLDDQNAQLKLAQGTLQTSLRSLPAGQSFEVDTPNVALQADGPGNYRIDAAPDGTSTTVTVREGSLTAYGDSGSVQIGPGQQLTFSGTNLQEAGGGTAQPPDALEAWAISRDRAEDSSVSARYVSRDVPGYEDLDANGTWEESPDYGQVWVPRVAAGWAPYQAGHWAWVAPWGWTWVDDAPWGFAPFHYGRWAYYRNNWAWVPGPIVATAPPCYAPALVAFVGGGGRGPSWGVSLTVGAVAAGVAWLPLGPGEPWRPAYHYSPRYYDRINHGGHTTIVNNVHNTYINRGAPRAITGMPANEFVRGQGARRYGQTVQPQQIARNPIGAGAPAIAPVQQSFGGGLRRANFRPPQTVGARPVIATRNAPTPFAYRDSLAQNFAKSGGRVQGGGQPVVRTAPPANFARIANVPGQTARGTTQPAFRVVPAERRPMPAQAQANRGAPGIAPSTGATREGQPRQGQGQFQPQIGQRPGDLSQQNPARRENGVPHPPDRTQAGRPDGQPGNTMLPPGQRGQIQGQQPQFDQQRDARGQPQSAQEAQERLQQQSQMQGMQRQQQAQDAQQRQQQQSQLQGMPRQRQQAEEAQQRQQQQSQTQATQRQQQQAQEAQQRQQQQSQLQGMPRQQQQAEEAQQRQQQQSQMQAMQRQQQQAQEAQQRQQQQAQMQATQRQQQQAQEAQQRQQQQSQMEAGQRQQQQAQEAQQRQQQQAQMQAAQRQQQQAQEAQQRQQQQAQVQAMQRQQQQAQEAQQRQQQQAQMQEQRQQQQAQEAQQRQQAAAQQREQQMQNQQRQQQMQMQNQQRQQQQQQQQQNRATPQQREGAARESQRNDEHHG